MRLISTTLLVFLLVHFLALVGFGGWLYATDRVNADRLSRMVELFKPTIEQEKLAEDEAQKLARKAQEEAMEALRLEKVARDGASTRAERLESSQMGEEVVKARLEALRKQQEAIRANVRLATERAQKQIEALQKARQDLELAVKEYQKRFEEESFAQARAMYEAAPPKLAKEWMIELIDQGGEDRVVDYLASMSKRKAGEILSSFKEEKDIPIATRLIEKLRERGVEYLKDTLNNEGGAV